MLVWLPTLDRAPTSSTCVTTPMTASSPMSPRHWLSTPTRPFRPTERTRAPSPISAPSPMVAPGATDARGPIRAPAPMRVVPGASPSSGFRRLPMSCVSTPTELPASIRAPGPTCTRRPILAPAPTVADGSITVMPICASSACAVARTAALRASPSSGSSQLISASASASMCAYASSPWLRASISRRSRCCQQSRLHVSGLPVFSIAARRPCAASPGSIQPCLLPAHAGPSRSSAILARPRIPFSSIAAATERYVGWPPASNCPSSSSTAVSGSASMMSPSMPLIPPPAALAAFMLNCTAGVSAIARIPAVVAGASGRTKPAAGSFQRGIVFQCRSASACGPRSVGPRSLRIRSMTLVASSSRLFMSASLTDRRGLFAGPRRFVSPSYPVATGFQKRVSAASRARLDRRRSSALIPPAGRCRGRPSLAPRVVQPCPAALARSLSRRDAPGEASVSEHRGDLSPQGLWGKGRAAGGSADTSGGPGGAVCAACTARSAHGFRGARLPTPTSAPFRCRTRRTP